MATVFLPSILRSLAGGVTTVDASGETLQEVLDDLERQHPGIRERVLEGGAFRPEIFVAIDGNEAFSVNDPVAPGAEVRILPAIAGGSGRLPAAV
jgi:molybdopterin converting factor small subunit